MADISEKEASQSVKVVGADSVGQESNYIKVDANGSVYNVLTSPGGTYAASVTGYGALRTAPEASSVFYDPFDTALDTLHKWNSSTSSGTGSVTQGTGGETLTGGLGASAISILTSKPSFIGTVPGYAQIGYALKLESGTAILNSNRFWGVGNPQASPTAANPMIDAVGWEIGIDGKLYAVIYNSGVKTVIADLSAITGNNKQFTDGAYHRYVMFMRTDRTFWYIDSLDTPVAVSSFQFPQTQKLPLHLHVFNNTVAPTTSPTIVCTGVGVGDTGRTSTAIGDGANGFYKATVTSAGDFTVSNGMVRTTSVNFADQLRVPATVMPNGLVAMDYAEHAQTLWGKRFIVTTNVVTIATTAETTMLYINNPAGSGKILKISKIYFGAPTSNNTNCLYRLYLNPTITINGTAVSAMGRRQTGQNASVCSFFTSPTATANGTLLEIHRVSSSAGEQPFDFQHGIFLEPGNRILVTATVSATALSAHANIEFIEEIL